MNLSAPKGYRWSTKFVDDPEYGWTAIATLWPKGRSETIWRRLFNSRAVFTGQACNYLLSPDELMASAKEAALSYLQEATTQDRRDAQFLARAETR